MPRAPGDDPTVPPVLLSSCPTPETPLVHDGLGAPRGLHPLEHVRWALSIPDPMAQVNVLMADDFDFALEQVAHMEAGEVDAFRREGLRRLLKLGADLEPEREAWLAQVPAAQRRLVGKLHGPLILKLAELMRWPDARLAGDLHGFPLVGVLPAAVYSSQTPTKQQPVVDVGQLRDDKQLWNAEVLLRLKDMPYSSDIAAEVQKDVDLGAMTPPVPLGDHHVANYLLMRRLPVREYKGSRWKTRIADHGTECGLNPCTALSDTIVHDTIDVLVEITLRHFARGVTGLRKFKRDVKRAFKRIGMKEEHLDLAGSVWQVGSERLFAAHLGMPFGTTSAGHGWHRFANVWMAAARRFLLVTAGRYVDDVFGADARGITVDGGMCMDVLSHLFGIVLDDGKAESTSGALAVLGALVTDAPQRGLVEVRVTEDKAAEWATQLRACLKTGCCEAGLSAKFAGRMSFAVTLAADKVGRAYIGPLYAQQFDPLPGGRVSTRWRRAAAWWIEYLLRRPPAVRALYDHQRPRVTIWTDAAGATRMLSAVVHAHGQFFYTMLAVPLCIWQSLLHREDNQIGVQETLAVALALGTFPHFLPRSRIVCYVDNDGARASMMKGASHSPEINTLVGRMWLEMATLQASFFSARVETHANIADGPSRGDCSLMVRLGACWVAPALPRWAHDLWSWHL